MKSIRHAFALLAVLAACRTILAAPPAVSTEPDGGKRPTVQVRVDPRIELLAAVQVLADYQSKGLLTRFDFPYQQRFVAHFEPHREHRAVEMFRRMSSQGFAYDAPVSAVLHLSNPPELKAIWPFDEDTQRRAGGAEQLDEFVSELRDFCRVSNFVEFYSNEQPFHDAVAKASAMNLKGVDVGVLEDYYGVKQHSYTIVTAPMFSPGGYGPRVPRANGSFDVYSVIGPGSVEDDLPSFGTPESFRYLVWHEFSHSFVNPAVDQHAEDVETYADLMKPIHSAMKSMAYPEWRICMYEHCVRAVTSRLAAREIGQEAYRNAVKYEKQRSFIYIEPLCKRLVEYEKQRDKYPTFESFFPELLAGLDASLAELPEIMASMPRVVCTVPESGSSGVDPTLTEIVVEFDHDMKQSGYAWIQRDPATFPETRGHPFWRTPRVCVLPVRLKPDQDYWIGLNANGFGAFQSTEGSAAEEFVLQFRTAASADEAEKAAIPPKVTSTIPETGATDVDPKLTELRVEFDQDMAPGSYSFVKSDLGSFPEVTGQPCWETPRVCVLPVKLQPCRTYWLGLNTGQFKSFMNNSGAAAGEYILKFTTGD